MSSPPPPSGEKPPEPKRRQPSAASQRKKQLLAQGTLSQKYRQRGGPAPRIPEGERARAVDALRQSIGILKRGPGHEHFTRTVNFLLTVTAELDIGARVAARVFL